MSVGIRDYENITKVSTNIILISIIQKCANQMVTLTTKYWYFLTQGFGVECGKK